MGEAVWFQLADEGMLDIKEMYCRIGKVNNYHMFQCFLARVQIPATTHWNSLVLIIMLKVQLSCLNDSRGGEGKEGEGGRD